MLENELKRIADNLEKVTMLLAEIAVKMYDQQTPVVTVRKRRPPIPATIAAAAASSEAVPVVSDRDLLVAELKEKGLPFPAKASTKRLKEILDTYGKEKQPELPIPQNRRQQEELAIPVPVKEATYSADEARDILKRFAAKFGTDKAIKVLTDFKAKDISAVAASGKLNDFVAAVLKEEKDNERK